MLFVEMDSLLVITLLFFDWRIAMVLMAGFAMVLMAGFAVFLFANSYLQKAALLRVVDPLHLPVE